MTGWRAVRRLVPEVLGALVRRYGHFDACEAAVQEALVAATAQWPVQRWPANPRGWLVTVASRRLADQLRSDAARRRREEAEAIRTLTPPVDVEVTCVLSPRGRCLPSVGREHRWRRSWVQLGPRVGGDRNPLEGGREPRKPATVQCGQRGESSIRARHTAGDHGREATAYGRRPGTLYQKARRAVAFSMTCRGSDGGASGGGDDPSTRRIGGAIRHESVGLWTRPDQEPSLTSSAELRWSRHAPGWRWWR